MKTLLELAATRPVVAWLLGYTPFLVLIAALVTYQSGWRQALVVACVNAALAGLPVGCVWGVSRLLARSGGTRAWWKERLGALAGGLGAFFVLALGATWLFDVALATGAGALLVAGLLTGQRRAARARDGGRGRRARADQGAASSCLTSFFGATAR